MRRYVMEFIGTFFLVLTIVLAVRTTELAPLAIGAVLTAMIFAGGHISGAHYNPAVTLAVFLRGKLETKDVLPYMGAQVAGALAAALLSFVAFDRRSTPALDLTGRELVAAFLVELLFTFALAFVILNVATSKSHPNNSFYGLAIGFTVMAGSFAVGSISGGAFNPAVGIALTVVGLAPWAMLLIYLPATLLGGAGAAYAFRYLNADDLAPVGSRQR
jgi:aquaporin Z